MKSITLLAVVLCVLALNSVQADPPSQLRLSLVAEPNKVYPFQPIRFRLSGTNSGNVPYETSLFEIGMSEPYLRQTIDDRIDFHRQGSFDGIVLVPEIIATPEMPDPVGGVPRLPEQLLGFNGRLRLQPQESESLTFTWIPALDEDLNFPKWFMTSGEIFVRFQHHQFQIRTGTKVAVGASAPIRIVVAEPEGADLRICDRLTKNPTLARYLLAPFIESKMLPTKEIVRELDTITRDAPDSVYAHFARWSLAQISIGGTDRAGIEPELYLPLSFRKLAVFPKREQVVSPSERKQAIQYLKAIDYSKFPSGFRALHFWSMITNDEAERNRIQALIEEHFYNDAERVIILNQTPSAAEMKELQADRIVIRGPRKKRHPSP